MTRPLVFYKHVGVSDDLRKVASTQESLLDDYCIEATMRRDVQQAKFNAKSNIGTSVYNLSPEEKRLVERFSEKREGYYLEDNQRN